jgi:hypothetical protein
MVIIHCKGQSLSSLEIIPNDNLVRINYNLSDQKNEYYKISLNVLSDDKTIYTKRKKGKNIYGDIGRGISPGFVSKTIYWNVIENNEELVGNNMVFEINALCLNQRSFKNLLFPGRHQFNSTNKKKHLLKSLVFYSAISLGLYYKSISSINYTKYNNSNNINEIEALYDKANISLQATYIFQAISFSILVDNLYQLLKRRK